MNFYQHLNKKKPYCAYKFVKVKNDDLNNLNNSNNKCDFESMFNREKYKKLYFLNILNEIIDEKYNIMTKSIFNTHIDLKLKQKNPHKILINKLDPITSDDFDEIFQIGKKFIEFIEFIRPDVILYN